MKFSTAVKGTLLGGAALVALKGLDDRLETTHYTVSHKKIPPGFDSFRIVQISDLHNAAVPGLINEITNENPDIIVITGDLVHDRGTYDNAIRICERLTKLCPVYFITGNHDVRRPDFSRFMADLSRTGVTTLDDTSITLKNGDSKITLSGIADPFSEDNSMIERNILKSVAKLPDTDNYHICLFHRANHMDTILGKGFDLIISGHMHGGQVRLPGGRGVCAPKSSWGSGKMLFPKYFAGHYKNGDTDMIVNRGIGNPMIIPRIFNRPEISVISLNQKKSV